MKNIICALFLTITLLSCGEPQLIEKEHHILYTNPPVQTLLRNKQQDEIEALSIDILPVEEEVIEEKTVFIMSEPLPVETEEVIKLDETKPLYEVYKNGFKINVSTELQWYIRKLSEEYGFIEKYLYGVILSESAFRYDARNGDCIGLCQVNKIWLESKYVKRITEDYMYRDLTNPYDNLLTVMEIWLWAVNAWDLDLSTEDGMMRVIYFHSNGRNPKDIKSSWYFDLISEYANELIPLQ